jgi:hypothetical protein
VTTLEETMHEAAVRALTQQEAALEALRARTGTVLTAASVIASFLGGQAITRNGLTHWVILALTAFGSVVLISLDALAPRRLHFWIDTEAAYIALLPYQDDDRSIARALARLHHDVLELNDPMIARLQRRARLAGAALALEVLLFGVGLA